MPTNVKFAMRDFATLYLDSHNYNNINCSLIPF